MFIELQRNFNNAPPPNNAAADAAAAGSLVVMLIVYAVLIIGILAVEILFLISLSKTLKAVAPKNREMEPGQVWLNLIPFFNYVWMFITVLRVADSLKNEYESQDLSGDGDYGKTMGLIAAISLFVCGCVTPIFAIIYWVKIVAYRKEIEGGSGRGGRSSRRDRRSRDDEDDDEGLGDFR